MKFGEMIRNDRRALGVSAGVLADHLNIAREYLLAVERGAVPALSAPRIRAIAAFFGTDPRRYLLAAGHERGWYRLPAADDESKEALEKDELATELMVLWVSLPPERVRAIREALVPMAATPPSDKRYQLALVSS